MKGTQGKLREKLTLLKCKETTIERKKEKERKKERKKYAKPKKKEIVFKGNF